MDKFNFDFNGKNVTIEVLKVIRMKTQNKIRFHVAIETYGGFECEFWLKIKLNSGSKRKCGYRFHWINTLFESVGDDIQFAFMQELGVKATRFFVARIMKDCFGGWEDEEALLEILRKAFVSAYMWEREKRKG